MQYGLLILFILIFIYHKILTELVPSEHFLFSCINWEINGHIIFGSDHTICPVLKWRRNVLRNSDSNILTIPDLYSAIDIFFVWSFIFIGKFESIFYNVFYKISAKKIFIVYLFICKKKSARNTIFFQEQVLKNRRKVKIKLNPITINNINLFQKRG